MMMYAFPCCHFLAVHCAPSALLALPAASIEVRLYSVLSLQHSGCGRFALVIRYYFTPHSAIRPQQPKRPMDAYAPCVCSFGTGSKRLTTTAYSSRRSTIAWPVLLLSQFKYGVVLTLDCDLYQ